MPIVQVANPDGFMRLMPGEEVLVLEAPPPGPAGFGRLLVWLVFGPAALVSLGASVVLGLLAGSWLWFCGLGAGAALLGVAGSVLGMLASARRRAGPRSTAQVTNLRAIVRRPGRIDQAMWSEVVGISAQRPSGASTAGGTAFFEVAALAAHAALDASSERRPATTPEYWSGAVGVHLKRADGAVVTLETSDAPDLGLRLARALGRRSADGRLELGT